MKTELNYQGAVITLECKEEYDYLSLLLLHISNSLYISAREYEGSGFHYLALADDTLSKNIHLCLNELRHSVEEDEY